MSMRYPGGVISATAPAALSGIWNLEQQLQKKAAGSWSGPPALWAWGSNASDQLGLGDSTYRSSPVQVGSLVDWKSVALSGRFAIATKTNNTLWAWGNNGFGQLGDTTVVSKSSPVQIGALTTWLEVSAGRYFTLARRTNNSIWAWGANTNGQLGRGDTTYRSSPVQIGSLTTWAQIVAGGGDTSLAIKTDGTLWSWGNGGFGGLGQNNATFLSSPVQVGALTDWKSVSAGVNTAAAVKTNGTMWTWGVNDQGQLGLGDTINRSSPVQVGSLTTWAQVSCGGGRVMIAIKTDGTLWAWGLNTSGQLGLNNVTSRSSPVQIGALATWSQLACGNYHVLAAKTDGTLWAWGSNPSGQLGLNDVADRSSPVQVGSSTTWIKLPTSMVLSNSSLVIKMS